MNDLTPKIDALMALPWLYQVEWFADEGGYYGATAAELEGVAGDGLTPEAAILSLKEGMAIWFEAHLEQGNEIPLPIAQAGYKGVITVRTTPTKHYALVRLAKRLGVSINRLLSDAIEITLKHC